MKFDCKYLSIGGNRHPAASDYDPVTGILAFGAGHGVALWKPLNHDAKGITTILRGHTGDVNAVRFFNPSEDGSRQLLLSGAADKIIRIWAQDDDGEWKCLTGLAAHEASVNCIACLGSLGFVASGAADGTLQILSILSTAMGRTRLNQTIELKPKYFPLAMAFHVLSRGSPVLVVGGTRSTIQVFSSDNSSIAGFHFHLAVTLTGHEGWIRSLDITQEKSEAASDLLIASASQDKYIRLWRIHRGADLPQLAAQDDGSRLGSVERSMSSKAQKFAASGIDYIVSFEALLLGHEDWVYTANWDKQSGNLRLVSASADSSLSIWEPEPTSGVWICSTRLGEISVQKGSTTATGSAGGFFSGLWFNNGKAVACLGRTGSWRVWSQQSEDGPWKPELGVTGHIGHVKGTAWAKDGSYLLSTSSDQTTRVHAEWKRDGQSSWHEIARPQIHGYDLNCVDSITALQFISGADEKLLRVFDEPSGVSVLLQSLSGAERDIDADAHDAASIPVLGLSNKAVEITADHDQETDGDISQQELASATVPVLSKDHPPYEDDLARHTLWPEKEKLYGHGYEISAVAASHDGKLVATACKASSIDHAVIRLYETTTWQELSPPLKAHSLTVTCMRFSDDDKYLLSVGRDRQWTVFARDSSDSNIYNVYASDPKGHSRMILGASWAPKTEGLPVIFATAGRDKSIKIWAMTEEKEFQCKTTITSESPVMTVEFQPRCRHGMFLLASGTEAGIVTLTSLSTKDWSSVSSYKLNERLSPSAPITQVSWRKRAESEDLLAIASEDSSVTIIAVGDWTQP